jgi:hypothetical protein
MSLKRDQRPASAAAMRKALRQAAPQVSSHTVGRQPVAGQTVIAGTPTTQDSPMRSTQANARPIAPKDSWPPASSVAKDEPPTVIADRAQPAARPRPRPVTSPAFQSPTRLEDSSKRMGYVIGAAALLVVVAIAFAVMSRSNANPSPAVSGQNPSVPDTGVSQPANAPVVPDAKNAAGASGSESRPATSAPDWSNSQPATAVETRNEPRSQESAASPNEASQESATAAEDQRESKPQDSSAATQNQPNQEPPPHRQGDETRHPPPRMIDEMRHPPPRPEDGMHPPPHRPPPRPPMRRPPGG